MGFSVAVHQSGWPTWERVSEELRDGRPLAIVQNYPITRGSHIFVVTGCHVAQGHALIIVYDPAGDGRFWWREYDEFATNETDRQMGYTYYGIRKTTQATCKTDDGPPDACNVATSTSLAYERNVAPALEAGPRIAGTGTSWAAAEAGLQRVRSIGQVDPPSVGFTSRGEARTEQLTLGVLYVHQTDGGPAMADPPAPQPYETVSDGYVYVATATGKELGFIEVTERGGAWRPVAYGATTAADVIRR